MRTKALCSLMCALAALAVAGAARAEQIKYDPAAYTALVNGNASQTIPEGTEVTNFVLEAKKRGYTVAIGALSPSQSAIGPYFFGQQPNVMVLAASSESNVNGPGTELGAMTNVTTTFTMNDINSDAIPDEDFQIPPDWKQKKESAFR